MLNILLLCVLSILGANAGWVSHHGMTSAQYQTNFNNYVGQGYRLTWVVGYAHAGTTLYAAIWEQKSGGNWVAKHGLTAAQYQAEFNTQVAAGLSLVHVSGYEVNGVDFYAAIWVQGGLPNAWQANHGLSSSAYQNLFNTLTSTGYGLIDFSGYARGGVATYAAIFETGQLQAWVARHGLTSDQYQAAFNENTANGYVPQKVICYNVGAQTLYMALWVKTGQSFVARHGMTSAQYQSAFDANGAAGYKLNSISGCWNGDWSYAAIWLK